MTTKIYRVTVLGREIDVFAGNVVEACDITIKHLNKVDFTEYKITDISKVELLSSALVKL